MTQPVNLNKFRKEKARTEKRVRADENAVKFGRTKAEKETVRKQSEQAAAELDGKKRDAPPS